MTIRDVTTPAAEVLECTLAALVFSLEEVFTRLESATLDEKEARRIESLAAALHDACSSLDAKGR